MVPVLTMALVVAPAPEPDEFFDPEKTGSDVEAMPEPEPEPEPAPEAPPMPQVEELPSKGAPPSDDAADDGGIFNLRAPDPQRPPAGSEGGTFFDPGKLEGASAGGGIVQIRGFVTANFFVQTRTDTQRRDAEGEFRRLDPLAFFDVRTAALYVGAPIYADVVYARVAFEFVSVPAAQDTGAFLDIIAQSRRFLFVEAAAIEVNPFTWAKKADRWFREGFKITGGVFIVPFGLEDEEHAAPANWFISRPRSMTTGRVYPGTWVDVGMSVKFKPTFREQNPIRPVELDVGFINGDPCTQSRFLSQLFSPTGLVPRCERRLRPGEAEGVAAQVPDGSARIDPPTGGVLPDNNGNKSVFARAQFFPLAALNFGGSFIYGKHPEGGRPPEVGQTPAELGQAPSWRVGAHVELDFDSMIQSPFPLPQLRGEFVYGEDHAVPRDPPEQTRRRMMGGYAQIAQGLFRRKKTTLPGLIVQYRFDHADPDLSVPGTRGGVELNSDFSDPVFLDESAVQGHTVGLRFPILPRFTLKTEYTHNLEDGGRTNQLSNDLFGFEMVVDF